MAVPEGLPMMVALVLSSNMKRMLKSNVLVRKMVGIETAGSLNILFTDKTGTLTEGKLNVVGFVDFLGNEYNKESLTQNEFMDIYYERVAEDEFYYAYQIPLHGYSHCRGYYVDKCYFLLA